MFKTLAVAALTAVALTGCGAGGYDQARADRERDAAVELIGQPSTALPSMYQAAVNRVEASTSCAELQGLFNSNISGASRTAGQDQFDGFMTVAEAANERMAEIGC
jgi:hypothetical protein